MWYILGGKSVKVGENEGTRSQAEQKWNNKQSMDTRYCMSKTNGKKNIGFNHFSSVFFCNFSTFHLYRVSGTLFPFQVVVRISNWIFPSLLASCCYPNANWFLFVLWAPSASYVMWYDVMWCDVCCFTFGISSSVLSVKHSQTGTKTERIKVNENNKVELERWNEAKNLNRTANRLENGIGIYRYGIHNNLIIKQKWNSRSDKRRLKRKWKKEKHYEQHKNHNGRMELCRCTVNEQTEHIERKESFGVKV